MSDNIIQFVPKPNQNRPTLIGEAEQKAEDFLNKAPSIACHHDTAPCDMPFHAPENDPA